MTLNELSLGKHACITAVGGQGAFRRRLLEIGLLPGTTVCRTGQAPLGDPLSFRVRGAIVTLRREDAQRVEVEPA